jgi:hypothetical protein
MLILKCAVGEYQFYFGSYVFCEARVSNFHRKWLLARFSYRESERTQLDLESCTERVRQSCVRYVHINARSVRGSSGRARELHRASEALLWSICTRKCPQCPCQRFSGDRCGVWHVNHAGRKVLPTEPHELCQNFSGKVQYSGRVFRMTSRWKAGTTLCQMAIMRGGGAHWRRVASFSFCSVCGCGETVHTQSCLSSENNKFLNIISVDFFGPTQAILLYFSAFSSYGFLNFAYFSCYAFRGMFGWYWINIWEIGTGLPSVFQSSHGQHSFLSTNIGGTKHIWNRSIKVWYSTRSTKE